MEKTIPASHGDSLSFNGETAKSKTDQKLSYTHTTQKKCKELPFNLRLIFMELRKDNAMRRRPDTKYDKSTDFQHDKEPSPYHQTTQNYNMNLQNYSTFHVSILYTKS